VTGMRDRVPKTIDMTASGEFVAPAGRSSPLGAWPIRIGLGAAAVAAVAGAVVLAAIFLWVASVLFPVALVAGAIAYVAFRYQARPRRR